MAGSTPRGHGVRKEAAMAARVRGALLVFASVVMLGAAWAAPVTQRELGLVLERAPDSAHGAKLYETCAACHGPAGEGVADASVPAIAGQHFAYIAKQLVDFRAGARGDTRMQHFSDTRHLAYSQHVADVAAHISRLQPRVSSQPSSHDAGYRGAMVYARACERCHGVTGEGNADELVPRLAGQHFEYLRDQLSDGAAKRRPSLAGAHAKAVASMPQEDLIAVAQYLASL